MTNADVLAREARHDAGATPKRPLALVRGEGATVWDAEGRAYVDCGATHGATNTGHRHPRVVEALAAQSERIWLGGGAYGSDARAGLLERLAAVAPPGLERAFLCNSGAEAVEAAIKLARGATGRQGLVAFRNGFHGRTLGALSLTWRGKYRRPFQPLVPGVTFAGYGDAEEAKAAITQETAAVFVEPVQGEGGVRLPPPEWLRLLRDLTEDRGALLVADEVQTGLGRTGRMWGVDHANVVPDAVCVAKSLAGGLPMGALLHGDAHRFAPMSHGSTFGGNPLACATAAAVLDVIVEEQLPERAAAMGERLLAGLQQLEGHAAVREARGVGLMAALELRTRARPLLEGLMARGVLALPSGATTARFLPPLVITKAQVDAALTATEKALAEVAPGA